MWYQFKITNNGNVALTDISVSDATFNIPVDCAFTSLAPTTSTTCIATSFHTVTLAEADAGQVVNNATATGTYAEIPYTATDTLTTPIQQNPSLTLTKSADQNSYSNVGQVITYTYTIKNSGNVTLAGPFNVSDNIIGTINPCGAGPLSPGATTTCQASHTITQYDLDLGELTNIATGHTVFSGNPVTSNEAGVTLLPVLNRAYTIVKTVLDVGGGGPGGHANQAGEVITYQIILTNTGNVSLIGVSVNDPLLDVLTGPVESGAADNVLRVGETWTYTGTKNVRQADIDTNGNGSGFIHNTVSATTTYIPVPQTASADVPVDQVAALSILKSVTEPTYSVIGDLLHYSYLVTNTGNVTLSGPFSVSDDRSTNVACPARTSLAPSASLTCNATYTVNQADLDAGAVTNNASAHGSFNSLPVTSATGTLTIHAIQNPALSILKSVTEASYSAVGDLLHYSYLVTNSGNVTLSGPFSVSDDRSTNVACPATASLAPFASLTCNGTYTITQADLDAGAVTNTASAHGSFNSLPVASSTDTRTVNAVQNPSIQIVKSLASYDDNDLNLIISLGDSLWYQFRVTNTGNVTLTGITVTDDTFAIPVTCPVTILAPSASTICTANSAHTITLVETANGQVSNTATVTGIFSGIPFSSSDTLETTVQAIVPSTISGQVRDDTNGNGILTDKDSGLSNVKIELDNGVCTLGLNCRSTLTDINGIFTFGNVPDGSYVLVETDPPNYISTGDSDPPNDNQIYVIILGGANSINNIFLDRVNPPACSNPDPTNGFVVSTNPANGATNVPLGNNIIQVTFNQPMITSGKASVLTAGNYQVKNTANGNAVAITGLSYDPVTLTVTMSIDTSDPNWQPGVLYNLTIKNIKNACGSSQNNVVRSFYTELGIIGQVRNNLDNKGIYGVFITLTGGSCGSGCGNTTTDLNGNFIFTGFAPGIYSLVETDPAGFHSISDSSGANDNQVPVTLTAGSNSTGNFFIDTPNICVAPSVGSTTPANGATWVSLSTTTLTVHFNQPMITYGGGSVLNVDNFSNAIHNLSLGGEVSILSISYDPNTYTATLTIDTSASAWQPGSQFRLRIANDIKNSCGTNLGSNVDVLFTTTDFISGQVRNNVDNNGIYGVTVALTGGSCGGTCATTSTDANGDFRFVGFAPGNYTLVETDLPGYISVSDSSLPNDNRIPLALSAGNNSSDNYFIDTPADCSAPGVSGSNPANGQVGVSLSTNTISVTFNRPMITYGGGSVLNHGHYENNLHNLSTGGNVSILNFSYDPNSYTVTLTIDTSSANWNPGSQYQLKINAGITNACNVNGQNETDILFTTDIAISGQVRNDLNGNGNLSDLDSGIAGVTIRLYNSGNTLIATTTTNTGGFYTFDTLSPGTYTIRETDPVGYVSTADSSGANDNQITVVLSAGSNSIGNIFLDHQ